MSVKGLSGYRYRQARSTRPRNEAPSDAGSSASGLSAVPTLCTVSGALALVLRMSRIFGIAPLHLERLDSDTWIIRVSKGIYIFNAFLISILTTLVLSATVLDLCIEQGQFIRISSVKRSATWLVSLVAALLITNISVFTASATMKAMIGILGRIQKINSDINNNDSVPHIEKRLKLIMLFFITYSSVTYVCDYYFVISNALEKTQTEIVAILSVSCVYIYNNHVSIYLLCSFVVLPIYSALKAINDHLDRLCHAIKKEGIQNIKNDAMIESHEIPFATLVPLRRVNIIIDRITFYSDVTLLPKKSDHVAVRTLLFSYSDACELMEKRNECFAVCTMMILLINIGHLLLAMYNILNILLVKADVYIAITVQVICIIQLVIAMLLLVEPCHKTYQEWIRTRHLIVQLTCLTDNIAGAMSIQLKRFTWCVCHCKILFSLLGACTFTRPVYISIIGAVTAYFVMAMQFNIDGTE